MAKSNTPKRKTLSRKGRLSTARDWMAKYEGKNLIAGYARWFGVDKICAIKELKSLGVLIPKQVEDQIVASLNTRAAQRKAAKDHVDQIDILDIFEHGEYLAFVAGKTSGGFEYGLTHEEMENFELDSGVDWYI